MNILYIIGSSPTRDEEGNLIKFKRSGAVTRIIQQFGDKIVYPPVYWYENKDYLIPYLKEIVEKNNVGAVVGYSAGGYPAFYLSNRYKIPALHLNSAIAPTSEAPTLHKLTPDLIKAPLNHNQMFIIGEDDRRATGGVDGHLVFRKLKNMGFKGEVYVIPHLHHTVDYELFNDAFSYFRNIYIGKVETEEDEEI